MTSEVSAIAVLSNLELLERAGVNTDGYLSAIGVERAALRPDVQLAWDPFARFLERAFDEVDWSRLMAACDDMSRQFPPLRDEPSVTSTRTALAFSVDGIARVLWPVLSSSFLDRGPGFCEIRVGVPEPRFCPRRFHDYNARAIAGFPAGLGQAPAHLRAVRTSPDGRDGVYLLEIEDERRSAPPGPLGDLVVGQAALGTIEIVELAGHEIGPFLEEHEIDRGKLLAGTPVRWGALVALVDAAERVVGADAVGNAAREFARLTRAVAPLLTDVTDALTAFQRLHGPAFVEELWGPFDRPEVIGLGSSTIVIRLLLRQGMAGGASFFRMQGAALGELPTNAGLPAAVACDVHIHEGGRGATYVVEVAPPVLACADPGVRAPSTYDARASSTLEHLTGAVYADRAAARVAAIERLGRALARGGDPEPLAELIVRELVEAVDAAGAEVRAEDAGRARVLAARGARSGMALSRTLEAGGTLVGAIHLWATPERSGPALAALDVMVPWIAAALGAALDRERRELTLARTEQSRADGERALLGVLGAHPGAAWVVGPSGQAVPLNPAADRAWKRCPAAVLAQIAVAMRDPVDGELDAFRVRDPDAVDRWILVERSRGAGTIEDRLSRAAQAWGLTPRQREVVALVVAGHSNKEIATELRCAEVTVENHLTAAFRRAGVAGRGQLVARLVVL